MTRRITLVLLFLATPAALAQGTPCRPFVGTVQSQVLDGHGYAKYLPATVKRLSDAPSDGSVLHPLASQATMFVSGADVRFRTDGVSPTATSGTLVKAGTILHFDAFQKPLLKELRFVQVSAGAEVDFNYCW